MPNLTPGDMHVMTPLGATGVVAPRRKKSFSASMDQEWRERKKQRKKKVKQIEYSPDWAVKSMSSIHIQKKFHSASNRRSLAAQKKALPDGSYPIADAEDLKNAATLAQSGHGNVSGAKSLISRRARALGVPNPLAKKEKVGKSAEDVVLWEPASSCFSLTE